MCAPTKHHHSSPSYPERQIQGSKYVHLQNITIVPISKIKWGNSMCAHKHHHCSCFSSCVPENITIVLPLFPFHVLPTWLFNIQYIRCSVSATLPTITSIMIPQPTFNIPNFEHVTTEKLTHYYAVAQRAMNELQRRYNAKALSLHYKAAEAAWHVNPNNNLTTFPPNTLTVEVVNRFYAKCDTICDTASPSTRTSECQASKNFDKHSVAATAEWCWYTRAIFTLWGPWTLCPINLSI